MAYNLSTVRSRVITGKLDDPDYDPSIVTDFINDTQRSIFNRQELPFMEKVFVGTLPNNEYIFEFPADFQLAQSLVIRTPELSNYDLSNNYLPFRDFNARFPAPSLSSTGRPSVWTTYGDKLYLNVRTDATYTLSMFYIKTPATLSDNAHVPEIPEEFQEVLVLGAYYRVLQRNEDYDLAAAVKQEYREELINMVTRLGKRQTAATQQMGQPLRSRTRRR